MPVLQKRPEERNRTRHELLILQYMVSSEGVYFKGRFLEGKRFRANPGIINEGSREP
jgi:hypothetical protein